MAFIAERVQKDAITRLEAFVNAPFERVSYTEAVALLQGSGQKFDFPVEWGLDLQTEHESWLTEVHVGRPVVVTDYPEHIKSFFMRLNDDGRTVAAMDRSEEHTSELQSLMRISYAVFCLKKKNSKDII